MPCHVNLFFCDIIAKKFIWIWLILIFSFVLFGCNRTEIGYTGGEATEAVTNKVGEEAAGLIDEEGSYDTADEVALYLITYHRLPGNYITKNEAKKLGWEIIDCSDGISPLPIDIINEKIMQALTGAML